jgi:hypothetical protein
MTVRVALFVAVACVAWVACAVAAGVATVVASDWRRATSTPVRTARTPVAFVDHGQTRYTTERAARWHARAWRLWLAAAALAAASVAVTVAVANRSDAVGRRWRSARVSAAPSDAHPRS